MRYPVLSSPDANAYLLARRGGNAVEVESFTKVRGEGADLDQTFIGELREELGALLGSFIVKLGVKDANRFEAAATRAVHSSIPRHSEILADPDFWIWLAVVHFADLVEWRYGNPEGGTRVANYGVAARGENLLFRLWLRAELVLDESAEDCYHLARAGQIEFWRSHMFRQGYANVGNFARALLRYQYPGDDPIAPKLSIKEIRELAKRLCRLRSNLFIEILEEHECRRVIENEAALVVTS